MQNLEQRSLVGTRERVGDRSCRIAGWLECDPARGCRTAIPRRPQVLGLLKICKTTDVQASYIKYYSLKNHFIFIYACMCGRGECSHVVPLETRKE